MFGYCDAEFDFFLQELLEREGNLPDGWFIDKLIGSVLGVMAPVAAFYCSICWQFAVQGNSVWHTEQFGEATKLALVTFGVAVCAIFLWSQDSKEHSQKQSTNADLGC